MQRCNANKLFQRNWRAASFSTCRQENMAVFTDAINKPGVFWNNSFWVVPASVNGEGALLL